MSFISKIKIKSFFYKFKWLFKNIFNNKNFILINNRKIEAPRFHKLELFQDLYPTYDKFLYYLVLKLGNYEFIDIGSNIGDTAINLYTSTNPPSKSTLIEPSKKFRKYLRINFKKLFPNLISKIRIISLPISSSKQIHDLSYNSSTATQTSNYEKIAAISIDRLLEKENYIKSELLIKIDIDGFDWDAIISAKEIINKTKPLIFFECVILNNYQYDGYLSSLDIILKNYQKVLILDNFGMPYFNGDLNRTILENIFLKSFLASKRRDVGYFYFDILLYNEGKVEIVNNAINKVINLI